MALTEGLSRRRLLQGAGSIAPVFVPASALGRGQATAPSDRISLGIIGVNGMGRSNLANCAKYPDVAVTAICDVAKDRRDAALAEHPSAKGHNDYRELLARRDVDAVIIDAAALAHGDGGGGREGR